MDLYLAGPMRNYPRWNFDAFEHATKALRHHRHTVRSPHEHDLSIGLDPDAPDADDNAEGALSQCLRWDFVQICEAGNVMLLPGWEKSTGCSMELRVARDVGAVVYELTHAGIGGVSYSVLGLQAQKERQLEEFVEDTLDRMGDIGPFEGVSFPHGDPSKVQWTTDPGPQVPKRIDITDHLHFVDPRGAEVLTSDLTGDEHVASLDPEVRRNLREQRITDAKTGGMKGSKVARMDLLPWDALADLSIHFGENSETHGGKYPDRNWEKGYAWSLGIASLGRHLAAWLSGEELDEEGHPHIRALHWHAATLHAFTLRGAGTDDRRTS